MPSSSLSWQQGLAGRNPAISFLTSAENEMPITSQGRCQRGTLGVLAPKVQSTERMTAPHTLLALYHTMVMARAIARRLWVLDHTEQLPPHHVGRSRMGRKATLAGLGRPGFAVPGLEAVKWPPPRRCAPAGTGSCRALPTSHCA